MTSGSVTLQNWEGGKRGCGVCERGDQWGMCAEITSKQDPGPCGGMCVREGALVTVAKLQPAALSFRCGLIGRFYTLKTYTHSHL